MNSASGSISPNAKSQRIPGKTCRKKDGGSEAPWTRPAARDVRQQRVGCKGCPRKHQLELHPAPRTRGWAPITCRLPGRTGERRGLPHEAVHCNHASGINRVGPEHGGAAALTINRPAAHAHHARRAARLLVLVACYIPVVGQTGVMLRRCYEMLALRPLAGSGGLNEGRRRAAPSQGRTGHEN